MSFNFNRRDFLQSAAGGALGLAVSGVSLTGISRLNAALAAEEVKVPGGAERWAPGICSLCPAGCGLRVRTIGKRAVKIQGNPWHPVNRGGLCPKGLAGLQELYHPDRLRQPLKNIGTRQSPRWRSMHWDEAIAEVVAVLRRLRAGGQAHAAVLIDRRSGALQSRLLRRFMTAYGSPNYFQMPSGLEAVQAALYLQQGVTQPVAYDLERTRYLLSFGVDLLEGWGSPATVMRAFGRWRDSAAGRRTKFVQIESRHSITAARADEWVPLRPGTEAALALGIAYVLISEGLYDADFVREQTFGFEDWTGADGKAHAGFRSLVLSEYRLNDVAALTDVPPGTILRLAREFARNRPSMALGDAQSSTLPGNPYAAMAVHSLNALVGSIDTPGGVLLQAELPLPAEEEPPSPWPRLDDSRFPFPGRPESGQRVSRLPAAIVARKPYPVQAVLLNECNPVFALPNGAAFADALGRVPFVASFSSFMDETSAMADVILPVATGLERWQEAGSAPAFPNALQAISPPVIEARHRTRHPADLVLEIARAIGDPVASALPYANFEEYLRRQVEKLFAAQGLSVFSSGLEETWNRLLERSGWWAPTYSTADELWEQMKVQGGAWEPSYYYGQWERAVRTPSRRFEFYSQVLAGWSAANSEFAGTVGLKPDDDRVCLPHQAPLPQPVADFPLLLLPIEVLAFSGGEGGHLPYLQQIAGSHLFSQWESWLEINPETAEKLHVRDGDLVWVESRRGRARVRARLYAGVRPGVVHLPLGYGHSEGSAWGRRGVNPLALIDERYEPVAGLPQTAGTSVKVYRA